MTETMVHDISIYSEEVMGNSNTTSFPVSRRYTDENESSLYSREVASFESRKLCPQFISMLYLHEQVWVRTL